MCVKTLNDIHFKTGGVYYWIGCATITHTSIFSFLVVTHTRLLTALNIKLFFEKKKKKKLNGTLYGSYISSQI